MSEQKTIRVKIPVVAFTTPEGKDRWCAWGLYDQMAAREEDRNEAERELLEDVPAGCCHRLVWVEADVPLPVKEVIEGSVSSE